MKTITLIAIILAIIVSVRGRKKYGRDEEIDRLLRRYAAVRKLKAMTGVAPSLDDIAMSQAKNRSD